MGLEVPTLESSRGLSGDCPEAGQGPRHQPLHRHVRPLVTSLHPGTLGMAKQELRTKTNYPTTQGAPPVHPVGSFCGPESCL